MFVTRVGVSRATLHRSVSCSTARSTVLVALGGGTRINAPFAAARQTVLVCCIFYIF